MQPTSDTIEKSNISMKKSNGNLSLNILKNMRILAAMAHTIKILNKFSTPFLFVFDLQYKMPPMKAK
jgi:hypothetical protein